MAIVSRTGQESLWSGSNNVDTAETAANYWVGSAPRLGEPDGSARYAHTSYSDEYQPICAAAQLVAFTWPDAGVRITAQVRLSAGWPGGEGMAVLGFYAPESGPTWPALPFDKSGIFDQTLVDSVSEWRTVSVTLAPFSAGGWQPEARQAAAGGALWVYATGNATGSDVFDVSWLQVETLGGPIATRVYPRADGLGMGAPRIMDGRSPYRSERVFGTP